MAKRTGWTRWAMRLAIASVALQAASVASAAPALSVTRVPANIEWVDTGIPVNAGEIIRIDAFGRALTGPLSDFPGAISGPNGQATNCLVAEVPFTPCALEGAPYGALVGRVGGVAFFVGASSGLLVMPASGTLELAINDNTGFYTDNKAGYVVRIFGGP